MKKKLRFKSFCFFIAFLILACFLYISSDRILINYAEKRFASLMSSASYLAIDKLVDTGYSYESLMKIEKNSDGDVNMIITDSKTVNGFASKIAEKAYEYLSGEVKKGVPVPVGAFTGIRMLSGFGAELNIKLLAVSSVKCEIISEFAGAGINQVRHSMSLKIKCNADIATKTGSKSVSDEISVLVYDNLLIGKVPYAYVNSSVIGRGEAE